MYIKTWKSHDLGVYQINPSLKNYFKKNTAERFSLKQIKSINKVARFLSEELASVFAHNLKKGWENILLANGRVTTKSNQLLSSKAEILRALASDGEIEFHTHRKNGSCAFIEKLLKPAHLRWD